MADLTKITVKILEVGEGVPQVSFKDGTFVILVVSQVIPSESLSLPLPLPEESDEEESDEEESDEEESDDDEEEEESDDEESDDEESDDEEDDEEEEESFWTKEEIEEMDRDDLTTLIEDEDLDVDPDDFPKTKALRKAVIKALEL